MDEFDAIAQWLAPLAGEGAFGLRDDAALVDGLVISKDVLVEGVHFRPEDPPDRVARKALRVNLSDVIVKGARPAHYFLGLTWPASITDEAMAQFAAGLEQDQREFGVTLMGGDTTRHSAPGAPFIISVTMMGRPISGVMVRRSGARDGDRVLLTGTIGDGFLGLRALQDGHSNSPAVDAYQVPPVSAAIAPIVAEAATASLDISDGLVADAGHLARASGVGLRLEAATIPLSPEGEAFVSDGGEVALVSLMTGGDDYQCMFTVAADRAAQTIQRAEKAGVRLTDIGVCTEGSSHVTVIGEGGAPIEINRAGYRHF